MRFRECQHHKGVVHETPAANRKTACGAVHSIPLHPLATVRARAFSPLATVTIRPIMSTGGAEERDQGQTCLMRYRCFVAKSSRQDPLDRMVLLDAGEAHVQPLELDA